MNTDLRLLLLANSKVDFRQKLVRKDENGAKSGKCIQMDFGECQSPIKSSCSIVLMNLY